jgi:hypothetical protein
LIRAITGVLVGAWLLLAPGFGAAESRAAEELPGIEVWLDRPLPTDAAPGTLVRIGGMVWHAEARIPVGRPTFVRLISADPGIEPSQVTPTQDWAGHFVADLLIPAGGIDRLEVGEHGTVCTDTGCQPMDLLHHVAGVGPPPDIPLTRIADVTILAPAEGLVAGQPATIELEVELRTDWAPELVTLPDALVVRVRPAREPSMLEVEARPSGPESRTYRATVTIAEEGDFLLQATLAAGPGEPPAGPDQTFSAVLRVTVEPAGGPEPAPTPAGLPDGVPTGQPAISPLVVGGLALAALGFSVVAGLSRMPRQ